MTIEQPKVSQTIIGTFKGECADSNITNNNGLDITKPVWDEVFESDEYAQGIEHRWYIGYLGHPNDPGCMDFRNACIVMTEGHVDDDGKVYGEFDLVDTPVGRVVKTFIDAGVTFGISVRGAGDIVNNSVEPGTFTFRGFDLVTFPAFPESIPEFQEIAASSDLEKQAKYKKVCAAVEVELPNINSCEAIDILQTQFPAQSETYQDLEQRKAEILDEVVPETTEVELPQTEELFATPQEELLHAQVQGLTQLYLDEKAQNDALKGELDESSRAFELERIAMSKKLSKVERICAAQGKLVNEKVKAVIAANSQLKAKNTITSAANAKLKTQLHEEKDKAIQASSDLDRETRSSKSAKRQLEDISQENLQYREKIQASEELLAEKDETIRSLQEQIDKTVVEASTATKRALNLEAKVDELQQEVTASQDLIAEYQDAYASIYSRAVGVSLNNVSVTASTTVSELQEAITGPKFNVSRSNVFVEPQQIDLSDDDDEFDLVTL